ncbi:hypothetical protein BO70DRAFT_367399 [Aspergillus heteromorphus CBS 117.55]|uniref:RBR-type E3 ubiquitin transferase n=1 Tax=Aspergillus heteromorphus CBS 117.55 TaxID=1448321 RepID=A0A317X3U0_9EURO|nr:uncharacterized protein BO70DRAFT_367399 [Aspergillus heteromorphus CBS 117.55]PWY92177.1 hypothetical protein BO70DRAFT_367399 [Aspergillus heteromorphus CBS 117.55]
MTFDPSISLTLQLLREDLEGLENQQKGKQVAGCHTDLEVAIQCMREDIIATQTSIEDGKLAISTSSAVASDQNVLAAIKQDEDLAEQDRRYALALGLGDEEQTGTITHDDDDDEDDHVPELRDIDSVPKVQNDDAVSVVMSDLMSRVTISDESASNGEGSSRAMISSQSQISDIQKECVSCLERVHTIMFRGRCGHEFCRDCVRQMFLGATKDEELYPPRCCGAVVPPGVALRVLHYDELRAFSERAMEWTAKDRLYCADPTCSRFIPPFSIEDELGTCESCKQQTHLTCRSLAHPGIDCPMDEALHTVLEMADSENWRRCFHCQTMVELQHGCNHITCRCGREFCYICGRVWRTCDCPLWHENRLIDMANQGVDEELPPNANELSHEGL